MAPGLGSLDGQVCAEDWGAQALMFNAMENKVLVTMEYGFITLLPTLLVLALAIWSRRTLESVLAGALFAFFIMEGFGFLDAMAEATLATLMTEDVAWVCLLYTSPSPRDRSLSRMPSSA